MILLDTNVLLWLFMGDSRLSSGIHRKIEQNPSSYFVSIVSLWEVATKRAIGKLEFTMDLSQAVESAGFSSLSLNRAHIYKYEQLPLLHRDPFDRMLVAQALAEGSSMVSDDKILGDYGVTIVAANPGI